MAIFNDFNRFTLWNCRQTFQSSNSTKGIFFVLKLLDSTLIAIVVVVWEEEAHKASLIFYGFKTHSLEIHHYIVNHTKFDCFLCVFKLISSSRWWWDCLVLNFFFFASIELHQTTISSHLKYHCARVSEKEKKVNFQRKPFWLIGMANIKVFSTSSSCCCLGWN